jgi:hypothetical protein
MSITRCGRGLLLFLIALLVVTPLFVQSVSAAQLSQRSLTLGATAAGATTTHEFAFTYASGTTIGSVAFTYCTSPLAQIVCDAPAGLDVSAATLQTQAGETGFVIQSQSANQIILSRAPSTATLASVYKFASAVNPTGAPGSFYVRITTYASLDGTDPETDFGAVVSATTQGVSIRSEVPPILNFCVGQSIPGDCSTADGNVVDLGVLRSSSASSSTSQLMAATNAEFGLAITANGTTMTSGNNIIPALNAPTQSAPGNAQFGLNLRANSVPPVGQNPSGAGIANPAAQYNIPNRFVFHPGDVIATSPDATDTRKFTVSYLANVSPSQPPGVYTATLTYICTASF